MYVQHNKASSKPTDFSPLLMFEEGQLPEVLDSLNPSNLTLVKIKHLYLFHSESHF